jgi:hypothetical protein
MMILAKFYHRKTKRDFIFSLLMSLEYVRKNAHVLAIVTNHKIPFDKFSRLFKGSHFSSIIKNEFIAHYCIL